MTQTSNFRKHGSPVILKELRTFGCDPTADPQPSSQTRNDGLFDFSILPNTGNRLPRTPTETDGYLILRRRASDDFALWLYVQERIYPSMRVMVWCRRIARGVSAYDKLDAFAFTAFAKLSTLVVTLVRRSLHSTCGTTFPHRAFRALPRLALLGY